MFGYYLDLALRSLRRNWIMTALMVLAIGLGIGASMTMLTVLHVMSGDPLPGRSAHLYRPWLDPLPLRYQKSAFGSDPRMFVTWPDAQALLRAHKAVRQAAMARAGLDVTTDRLGDSSESVSGVYTTRDFFSMFGVPFVQGHAWSAQADARRTPVVVLAQSLARKLFHKQAAVGQVVQLDKHAFRVVGVVADWHPRPLFYAGPTTPHFSAADQFFLPLSTAVGMKLHVNNETGWGEDHDAATSLTGANMAWLQVWVELDTPAQVAVYKNFLDHYVTQQKDSGRYERAGTDARLYSLMGWLSHEGMIPVDVRLQSWLALGFLFVCMVNIVALLLAKFLRRKAEISVRRALGAKRRDIFVQFGIESAVIGVSGGLLGLAIAQFGLWSVRQRPDDYAHLAQMDASMLVSTVVLAIVVSVLAGLLPAWRACRIAPALQLKEL